MHHQHHHISSSSNRRDRNRLGCVNGHEREGGQRERLADSGGSHLLNLLWGSTCTARAAPFLEVVAAAMAGLICHHFTFTTYPLSTPAVLLGVTLPWPFRPLSP